jgi:outer membrane protein assembly factor BamB
MYATDSASGKPVLANDKAIFASYDGRVYAISTANGAVSWTYNAEGKIALEPQLFSEGRAAPRTRKS